MGKNRLFQEARRFVNQAAEMSTATNVSEADKEKAIEVAKNALSSAHPNSTTAEKRQLRDFQETLDRLE